MKKLFLNVHKNGNVTTSNYPIQDGDATLKVVEVTEKEYAKAFGPYQVGFVNEKLTFKPMKPYVSPKRLLREQLKKKLEKGTATDEDVKNALKLLL